MGIQDWQFSEITSPNNTQTCYHYIQIDNLMIRLVIYLGDFYANYHIS